MAVAHSQGFFATIKRLKLQLAYLLLAVFCIFFYWVDAHQATWPQWVPAFPPYKSLAEACLTTLMVSFIYEAWIRRESQAELHQSILSPHIVKTVLSDEAVRELTEAGFQRMLKSDEFGSEVFGLFTDLSFSASRRRYDVRTELTLLPLGTDTPFSYSAEQDQFYFNLRSALSYKRPMRTRQIWFRCVREAGVLRDVLADDATEWRWYVPQHKYFAGVDASFFRVFDLEIDGQPVPVQTQLEQGTLGYFADVPKDTLGKPAVRLRFKVDVKVRKTAQYVFTDIVHPVRDIVVSFDASNVPEVRETGVVPIFSSASRPRQDFSPSPQEPRSIAVSVDGWSIPDSGVAFFWRLR